MKAPERAELEALAQTMARRVGRHLERRGLLERDAENGYLAREAQGEGRMDPLLGTPSPTASRLARHQGRKAFTLQTLAASAGRRSTSGCGQAAGSPCTPGWRPRPGSGRSSNGSAATLPARRWRPSGSRSPLGQVRYQLKTPYRDGTTHVVFEPVDFIARLAALVPKPRVNLTRYRVFAPNSRTRAGHPGPAGQGRPAPGEGARDGGRAPRGR